MVFDHTETFRSSAFLRPFARWLLECHGALVVGPPAASCLIADDKAAAKARLRDAGVPTAPGVVLAAASDAVPAELGGPLVVKPAFEHMSRGLHLAPTPAAAREAAIALLERLGQPVLVERFVPGRELAISLLDGHGEPEVLPVLEWRLAGGAEGVLDEPSKLRFVTEERQDLGLATLSPELRARLRTLALRAFAALGLRDYARFDVRLADDGTPFFLEANVTPSMEPFEAFPLAARAAGLDYPALVARLLRGALRRGGGGAGQR